MKFDKLFEQYMQLQQAAPKAFKVSKHRALFKEQRVSMQKTFSRDDIEGTLTTRPYPVYIAGEVDYTTLSDDGGGYHDLSVEIKDVRIDSVYFFPAGVEEGVVITDELTYEEYAEVEAILREACTIYAE